VPPAVAALQSTAREPERPRRIPERKREANWLLPAVLGGALVLALIGWAASDAGAPDAPTAETPGDVPVAVADPAPPDQGAADSVAVAAVPTENARPSETADPFDAPLRGSGTVDAERGGFTWVVTREGTPPAEQAANYRAAGYRAGVLRSEVDGRSIERVCLGQFRTTGEALAARPDLPASVPADRWLLRLSP
jgi:hypothetical protein